MDFEAEREITQLRTEIAGLHAKVEIILARQFADEILLKAMASHVASRDFIRNPLLRSLRQIAKDFQGLTRDNRMHSLAAGRLLELAEELEARWR